MELSEKLTKIVNGYMRMQYSITLRTLATTTKIVNDRRKSNCVEDESKFSLFNYSNAMAQGEFVTQIVAHKACDILSDTKPNPPIA